MENQGAQLKEVEHAQFAFKLLTAADVAGILGLKEQAVYRFAQKGIIPCVKIGALVRFNSKEIERWIEDGGTK